MEKEWAIYFTHKNGETSVSHEKRMVVVRTYEECQKFIANFKPGHWETLTVASHTPFTTRVKSPFSHDPSQEPFFTRCRAVPRSEYDPRRHDTYHLRLGSCLDDATKAASQVAKRAGFLVDEGNIGSVLDAMAKLRDYVSKTRTGGVKAVHSMETAHPFVWKPNMISICNDAIGQLKEDVSVTVDLLPLNPSIWLFYKVNLIMDSAQNCLEPETADGHIPWPDELAFDVGRFELARIFTLDDGELSYCHVNLELAESKWAVRLFEVPLKVGSVPDEDSQDVIKALLFVQSPYLVWKAERPGRSFIRRAKGQFPIAEERISIILLRRMVELRKGAQGEGEPIEWSCQWWVSGHWRRQWHPSTKTHKPTWIAPYIKGPPDKPLKDTVRLIVR